MADHPSFFELDLCAIGQASQMTSGHVGQCSQCQVYLAQTQPEAAIPPWVANARVKQPLRWAWWLRLATAGLALSAAVAFVLPRQFQNNEGELTRSKSMPSFALYVGHEGKVRLWDGHSHVAAGDRLQLKVAPVGYRHLVVATQREGQWASLFQGEVAPSREAVLPEGWEVDAQDESIILGVLLCDAQCNLDDLTRAAPHSTRNAKFWFSQFSLLRGPQ